MARVETPNGRVLEVDDEKADQILSRLPGARRLDATPTPTGDVVVTLPSGREVKTTAEKAEQIRARLGDVKVAPDVSGLESLARGGAQGLTLGFADEMAAATRAGLQTADTRADMEREALKRRDGEGFTDYLRRLWQTDREITEQVIRPEYEREVAESRAKDRAAREANPWTFGGGQVAGSLAPIVLTGGQATAGGRVLAGAAHGGVSGVGMSEAKDLEGIAKDAAIGTALGGAFSAGGEAIGAGIRKGAEVLGRGLQGTGQAFARRSAEATVGQADEAAKAARAEAQTLSSQMEALPERVLADQAKREAANAKRLLDAAKAAANSSDEAARLAEAEAALRTAREAQKAAARTLDTSAEKAALDALDAEVRAARAQAGAAKKAWEASPQATHMRESAEAAALARKRFETLKELRRLDPRVQAATRKAWDAKKGAGSFDEMYARGELSDEARILVQQLDREAWETIQTHGLNKAIERARGAMKQAERKAMTSRQAAEQAEAAARESIQMAERVRRGAEARLAQAMKAPTTKGMRDALRQSQLAVKRAEEALQKARSEAQASQAAANLRAAQAALQDAQEQAARLGARSVEAEGALRAPLEQAIAKAKTTDAAARGMRQRLDQIPESTLSRGLKRVSERVRGDDMVDLGALSVGATAGALAGGVAGGGIGALAAPIAKAALQNFLRNPQQTQAVADVLLRAAQRSQALSTYMPVLTDGIEVGTAAGARQMLQRHVTLMEVDPVYRAEVERLEAEDAASDPLQVALNP